MEKPSIPPGTRDFGPLQVARRRYILGVIRRTFELFGYAPLETPTLENLSVLTGKYGDEGDQLLFKVLNSGNFLVKERRGEITPLVTPEDLEAGPRAVLPKIAEKGLRYDLTVPFARYVAMNRGTLTFPFRRYQMQPVWRADRPQRGRYREFWQCDADVVGTDSLLCEAEIVLMMSRVLGELGLADYTIKINHRGVLSGLFQLMGGLGSENKFLVSLDKLDKIGWTGVENELVEQGFLSFQISTLRKFLDNPVGHQVKENSHNVWANRLKNRGLFFEAYAGINNDYSDGLAVPNFQKAQEAIKTINEVSDMLEASSFPHFAQLEFDPTLARGLSYYTGCIFEVKINNVPGMGSVSGGGRYDNLTGSFGLPGVSGVGFSFGVDRLYDCLEALDLFPPFSETPTWVLLTNFGGESTAQTLPLLAELRAAGIPAELYPDAGKLPQQFKYADAKGIPLVVILGPEEVAAGIVKLKTLATGEESTLALGEAATAIRARLG